VETLRTRDALAFGEEVWRIMQAEHVAPENVGVDSVGIGSNVVNYMRRVLPPGKFIHSIEGGAEDPISGVMKSLAPTVAPGREYQPDANRFFNHRAQVYWQLAQDLQHGLIALPRHEQLWRELTVITYSTEGGEVRLPKKADIIKKLGRSPDYADAVAYGDWVRSRAPRVVRPYQVEKQEGRSLPLSSMLGSDVVCTNAASRRRCRRSTKRRLPRCSAALPGIRRLNVRSVSVCRCGTAIATACLRGDNSCGRITRGMWPQLCNHLMSSMSVAL
jgi:hypothetical protein